MTQEFKELYGIPINLLEAPKEYEKGLPHLSRTLSFINSFRRATKPKARESLLDQMAIQIVKDPSSLVDIMDNFDLINQVRPQADLPELQVLVLQQAEGAVTKRTNFSSWNPKKIEQLILLGLTSSEAYKPAFITLQRALFNSPRTIEESIDLHYRSAWAMVETSSFDVRSRIFSILCLETDILSANSFSVISFTGGSLANSDAYLGKYYATMDAIDQVGIYLETLADKDFNYYFDSRRAWERVFRIQEANQNLPPSLELMLSGEFKRHTRGYEKRIEKMQQATSGMQDQKPGELIQGGTMRKSIEIVRREKERLAKLTWPRSIIENPNEPLRRLTFQDFGSRLFKAHWENWVVYQRQFGFELLTVRPIQITDNLSLSIMAQGCESPEQRAALVREVSESLILGRPANPLRKLSDEIELGFALDESWIGFGYRNEFDAEKTIVYAIWRTTHEEQAGKLASLLEYHRPLIPLEELPKIENQISLVRGDIRVGFTKAVGRRGYKLIVADPILRRFGYQSITFRQAEDNSINVTFEIAGQSYDFALDENYAIIQGRGDVKRFSTFQDQAWLELLTLSHLKKLVCTEESQIVRELLGKEKQLQAYRKQSVNKIEHIRRMPPGWHWSTEAYLRCLRSGLPIKRLDKINQLKAEKGEGGTIEAGLWTYVSPAEKVDVSTMGPIKIAFANATDDIRRVIPLDKPSEEELARIEKDLLEKEIAA